MADSVTIFQSITETEKLTARLDKNNQDVGFTFDPKDKEKSLLYSAYLERFVDQLRETLKDFKNSSSGTSLATIQLSLLGIPKEDVSKKELRQFFNQLREKFISDSLDDVYSYIRNLPKFPEIESPGLSTDDDVAIEAWLEGIVKDLEKTAKTNVEENLEKIETPEEEKKAVDTSFVGAGGLGLSGLFGKNSDQNNLPANQTPNQQVNNAPPPGTQPANSLSSPLNIQKLAAQEGWRDSSALLDDVLNSAFEVKNWRALYDSLPADQQRKLDFQLYSIQEDLAGVISLYLQEKPEFAFLLSQSQRLSVTDRIKIRAALMTQVGEIYAKLTKHEYFMMKAGVLKEGLGLQAAFDPSHFKGSEQTAQDATKLFMEKQDQEDTGPKNYSLLQQQEFKRQLKQIAVFNALISNESIEDIGRRILQMSPGANGIELEDLNLMFQEMPGSGFSLPTLGIDQRKQLLVEINAYLLNLHSDGKTINEGNFENFKKFKDFERNNPKEALASLLKAYGIDGVSEKNIRNTLDAYVLSLGSPHLLSENLRGVLNTIDPRLRDSNEMLRILESYVAERKYTLADYTGNNLLTYSLEPDAETALAFSTEQYRTMILEYSKSYQGDTDKILAHAFFNRELANIPDDISEQERYYREEAKRVRDAYLQQLERGILAASAADKEYYAQLFGVNRQQFMSAGQNELDSRGEAGYNRALFEAAQQYQPWKAPNVGGGKDMAQGLNNLRSWLSKSKSLGNINAQSLKGVSSNLVSSQLKKAAVPVAAGASGVGLGMALVTQIFGTAQSVLIGSGLGGIGGGIVGGFVVGGPFGALAGGFLGAVGGGALGYLSSGGAGSTTAATAAKTLASNYTGSALSSASNGLTSVANAATQTLTTAGATISSSTSVIAVGVPLVATSALTFLVIEMVLVAFLPDASTTQVAPYFSLDVEVSRYVTLKKIADPSNMAGPGMISYTITLSKKEDATEEIIITEFTDTPSAIDVDSTPIDPPSIPPEALEQLKAFEGKTLAPGETLQVELILDASDARFQDSLVRNDIKVMFTADGTAEESASRAQTCVGDCPATTVPACWPVKGWITQVPYATGPKSNPVENAETKRRGFTHYRGKLDSYDIGADAGYPIFAVATGTVTIAGPHGGYGNLVAIDHGGWQSYYGHQPDRENGGIVVNVGDPVEGGQLIGHVDSTGVSDINHLHYEIRGLNEYILISLFGNETSGRSVLTEGPRCDEFYGK